MHDGALLVAVHRPGSEAEDVDQEAVRGLEVAVDEEREPAYGDRLVAEAGEQVEELRVGGGAALQEPGLDGADALALPRVRASCSSRSARWRRAIARRSVSSGATSATGVPRRRWILIR